MLLFPPTGPFSLASILPVAAWMLHGEEAFILPAIDGDPDGIERHPSSPCSGASGTREHADQQGATSDGSKNGEGGSGMARQGECQASARIAQKPSGAVGRSSYPFIHQHGGAEAGGNGRWKG